MAFPSVTWSQLLEPGARQEAEQFAAMVQGFLSFQHNDDGSHGEITADSIVTTGDVTVGEDLIVDGTLSGISRNGLDPILLIGTNTTIDGSLSVDSTLSVASNAFVEGNLEVTGTFSAVENSGVNKDFSVGLDLSVDGDLILGGVTVAMTTPTFSAGNFTANGSMTWTVASQDTYQYMVVSNVMYLNFIIGGTVGGTPDTLLKIAIPGGYTCQKRTIVPIISNNAGSLRASFAQIAASGTTVDCSFNNLEANWTAGDATVYGQVFFEVA